MHGKPFIAVVVVLVSMCLAASIHFGQAQNIPLVTLGTPWLYNQTGTNLATAWIGPGYDDTAAGWEGPGLPLFGFETNEDQYKALGVDFNSRFPDPQFTFRTNHYFRTHFNMSSYSPAILATTTLLTSNWIDDGAVFYLNGAELGRFNMPTGLVTAATFATASVTEPVFFRSNYLAASLIAGDNVLAVEVHQSSFNNSDAVFGMTVTAIIPSPPSIATQPIGQTNLLGATNAILSVAATGTPPLFYQWYSNAAPVIRATNDSYTVFTAKTNVTHYYVVVSNSVGFATSTTARVVIIRDTFPPTLVSAVTGPPPGTVSSNQVLITFNKRVNSTSAGAVSNYAVTILGTTNIVQVTIAQVALNQVKLTLGSYLGFATNYVLTVNRVADTNLNLILPNSQIGISFGSLHFFTNLISTEQNWVWDENLDDPGPAWKDLDYVVPSSWGGPTSGFFYAIAGGGPPPYLFCPPNNQPTAIPLGGYSSWAYYFRTHFNMPFGFPAEGVLTFTHRIDDGAIFYLNGAEIFRYNMPAGPVRPSDPAIAPVTNTTCIVTNVGVTNLMAGDNVLGVEVHQSDSFSAGQDILFGTLMDLNYPLTSPLPPKLTISKQFSTNEVLSWFKVGNLNWGLEFTPDLLNTNAIWTPLPDPSPYTNSSAAESRFFRLHVR